ncbi:hypothetical protein GE061_013283 [Apolygus lucorum]|uniref:Uncharacterized protein n=1 Tax=Apolygus lucorum TaxID=248454 RepID=A0A6A4JK98_APOLU|nr:hypothetical protein GE061_013283 [Apolygus lucorum]
MNFYVLFNFIYVIHLSSVSSSSLQRIVAKFESEILSSELLVLASELDDRFNAELNNMQEPLMSTYDLDDLYFHANNCTVTTWNGKMYYDGRGKKTHTDLHRGIVMLHIKSNTLAVEASFKVNRLAVGDITSLAIGKTRTTYKDLKCDGMAALYAKTRLSIEWIHLFCDFTEAQIKTEVEIDNILRGKEVEQFMNKNFTRSLEEKFERDVTTGLERLVSPWLESRLDTIASQINITSATNQAYQLAAQQEALEANDVLDGILAFASSLIKENYNDSIRIPDIREGFEKNLSVLRLLMGLPCSGLCRWLFSVLTSDYVLSSAPHHLLAAIDSAVSNKTEESVLYVVKVGAQFLATEGKAYGVSSIERVGTARLNRNGTKVYFSSAFRFKELFVMYNRYRAEVIGIGPTGTISTSLAPVTARVMVHVDFQERKVYLDRLRIAELGRIEVRITGLGRVLNFVVSRIVTWVVAAFKNQILNLVEDRVRRYTRATLERSSLDDILAGRALKR